MFLEERYPWQILPRMLPLGTPVLYTTGQGLTDGMQAMFVERFGFLAKPYTPEQLVIAVENLLSKN